MKKLLTVLLVVFFAVGMLVPTNSHSENTVDENVVVLGLMAIPILIQSTVTASACVSAPEVALPILTLYGAWKHHIGDWGKDGRYAYKGCLGENTSGNCANIELTKYQKDIYLAELKGELLPIQIVFHAPTKVNEPSAYSNSLIEKRNIQLASR